MSCGLFCGRSFRQRHVNLSLCVSLSNKCRCDKQVVNIHPLPTLVDILGVFLSYYAIKLINPSMFCTNFEQWSNLSVKNNWVNCAEHDFIFIASKLRGIFHCKQRVPRIWSQCILDQVVQVQSITSIKLLRLLTIIQVSALNIKVKILWDRHEIRRCDLRHLK